MNCEENENNSTERKMQAADITLIVKVNGTELTTKNVIPMCVAEDITQTILHNWKEDYLFTTNEIEFYSNAKLY